MSNDWEYSSYSKINSEVKENFPFEKPRQHQLETISEIKEAIDNGYKYIVLEAGTGTGKSAIAATLALMYDSTYILTVTKQLQDQYLQDFKNLGFKLVKGRSNFKCKKYAEDNLDYSCDEGRCVLEGYRCEYSLNRSHDDIARNNTCPYYYQKFVAMNSSVVISNYPYMFLELNFVEDFKKRKLMIFDEAHNLENNLMSQLKLEFKRKDLKEHVGINLSMDLVKKLELGDYTDWIRFIKRIRSNYSRELNKIKDIKGNSGINEKKSFLRLKISDCDRFLEHIQRDPHKWIFDFDRRFGVAEFKPLKVDNYAKQNLFKFGDVCIFMSATILDYKLFAKWLGIEEDEIYAIRRESPFEVNRNPIKTYDEFRMSYGNLTEVAPKTVEVIDEILEVHKNDKGIIHTISHQCKNFLKKSLKNDRLIDHNTSNRAEQLERFKKSNDPLVLISPSMNEGVDLPGDQCRFQIIYKIPYPSLGDKQTKERKNIDSQWYDYKTALALVQTYGRGMRFEQDYCKTYFIDNRLKGFITTDRLTNNFLPNFFIQAIDISPAVIDADEKIDYESVELRKDVVQKFDIEDEKLDDIPEEVVKINPIIDDSDFEAKRNQKLELIYKGKELLEKEEFNEAIEFYEGLLNHELFINDYHPYLKLAKAYHGAQKFEKEVETLSNFYKSGRYCRQSTLKWFKKQLKKLAEVGYFDIAQLDELENEYDRRGKKNRNLSKTPLPCSHDLMIGAKNKDKVHKLLDPGIFDEFVSFDDDLTYDEKIEFKYNLIKKGEKLIDDNKIAEAIAYYRRLLTHELFINDYHPYLKLYRAYGKDKNKEGQRDILVEFLKSRVYCNEKKFKWFRSRLKDLSRYGLINPLKIDELEEEFYANSVLNKNIANKPVPIAIEIKKLFESDDNKVIEPKSNYSRKYFLDLSKDIRDQPNYEGYVDLTKHNPDDYIQFDNEELINQKADFKLKGKQIENEDLEEAIKFYDELKENELFEYDYYPYRRQCILFKNYIHDDEGDWQTILELLSKKIYLNNHQYTWINNKIIELIDKLNLKQSEVNKINSLLENYEINKVNYKMLQDNYIPLAERIFKDEESGLKVLSNEKYDYIENIHYINELGAGYIRRGDYETAMIFYSKMLNQNILYFKCMAYKSLARIFKEMNDDREFARLYEKYIGD